MNEVNCFEIEPAMPGYLRIIKKRNFIVFIIGIFIFLGSLLCSGFNRSAAIQPLQKTVDSSFSESITCKNCHKDIYESHLRTAHYLTSRPASEAYIKGSFDSGKNHFRYNKFMEVVLEKNEDRFFQTAVINGLPFQSESMDVVIGSGRKGQTYLYWDENRLFQLPVSYYTPLNSWCNSPGYNSALIRFNRAIPARCIECHGTYAKTKTDSSKATLFNKSSIVYGIECERCHGSSAAHVTYHLNNPTEKVAKYIINPKLLSRIQRLDACALCHSGIRKEIKPAFTFKEGDKLDDFSVANYNTDSLSALDVHGNQYGLFTSSKCFKMSNQMDCSSCHNVHKEEVNTPATFSSRCMNCHNDAAHSACTLPAVKGLTLSNNCIDCHMPLLPSKKIFLQLNDPGKSTPDFVRTHRIAIYTKETKDFINRIEAQNK